MYFGRVECYSVWHRISCMLVHACVLWQMLEKKTVYQKKNSTKRIIQCLKIHFTLWISVVFLAQAELLVFDRSQKRFWFHLSHPLETQKKSITKCLLFLKSEFCRVLGFTSANITHYKKVNFFIIINSCAKLNVLHKGHSWGARYKRQHHFQN